MTVKDDEFLNYITSQEKLIYKIYKKLVDSKSLSKETRRHLKPVGNKTEIMYGSCKVHKKCIDHCPPFISILSALQTATYKLEVFSAYFRAIDY